VGEFTNRLTQQKFLLNFLKKKLFKKCLFNIFFITKNFETIFLSDLVKFAQLITCVMTLVGHDNKFSEHDDMFFPFFRSGCAALMAD
jgi:hypothetical protein